MLKNLITRYWIYHVHGDHGLQVTLVLDRRSLRTNTFQVWLN